MTEFNYIAPNSLFKCLKVLEGNPDAKVIAGGTDLLVKIRDKRVHPNLVVDIKKIPDFKGIGFDADGNLHIAPLTTHADISQSPIIQRKFPFLAKACSIVGSQQIRNRGTIGGNICNGSPAAETLAPLYLLDAKLYIESLQGEMTVPIDKFFTGPQKTIIKHTEILTNIEIPVIKEKSGGVYLRQGRRNAVDIAMVTCAAMWIEDKTKPSGRRYKIALGCVAPTVVRALNAEEYLNNVGYCGDDVIEKAALTALKDISPIDDIRTTCNYRNDITYVLIKRAITEMVCGR